MYSSYTIFTASYVMSTVSPVRSSLIMADQSSSIHSISKMGAQPSFVSTTESVRIKQNTHPTVSDGTVTLRTVTTSTSAVKAVNMSISLSTTTKKSKKSIFPLLYTLLGLGLVIICIIISALGICFLHGWCEHQPEQHLSNEDGRTLLTSTNTDNYSSTISGTNPSDVFSQRSSPFVPIQNQEANLATRMRITFDDGTF